MGRLRETGAAFFYALCPADSTTPGRREKTVMFQIVVIEVLLASGGFVRAGPASMRKIPEPPSRSIS
jgi:hypothetical protein